MNLGVQEDDGDEVEGEESLAFPLTHFPFQVSLWVREQTGGCLEGGHGLGLRTGWWRGEMGGTTALLSR